jgi:hypothetical protein
MAGVGGNAGLPRLLPCSTLQFQHNPFDRLRAQSKVEGLEWVARLSGFEMNFAALNVCEGILVGL